LEAATIFKKKQLSVIFHGKPKLKGGSTIENVKVRTKLARVCEVTLTVQPLWVRPSFSQNPHPERHYTLFRAKHIICHFIPLHSP